MFDKSGVIICLFTNRCVLAELQQQKDIKGLFDFLAG